MKKKLVVILLCTALICSLTACEGLPFAFSDFRLPGTRGGIQPISISTGAGHANRYYPGTYKSLVEVTYPIVLAEDPALSALSAAFAAQNAEDKEAHLAFLQDTAANAEEMYFRMPQYFNPYEQETRVFVCRADTKVTSLLYMGHVYTGGAHGNIFCKGDTYNTETGAHLTLPDVVADRSAFAAAVLEQLRAFWDESEPFPSTEMIEEILADEKMFAWTLAYNGITVYFPPYTIASYAAGTRVATVANAEYPGVLKAEYTKAPRAYGVELSPSLPYYYDVTGDGRVDEIFLSAYGCDDYGHMGSISIQINGMPFEEAEWFYNAIPTFVHTADGANYIYVEIDGDNDYRQTICYALDGGVRRMDMISGGLRYTYHPEEDGFFSSRSAMTNPESFRYQIRTAQLSTVEGHKEYRVGQGGQLETDDTFYRFTGGHIPTFTVLQEISGEVYDEKTGKIRGRRTLAEGEKVEYFATDDERYAYLQTADGTVLRLEVEYNGAYYRMVEGKNIDDVFEGLVFAG